MENFILFPADDRGHANHGWLDSYHSFSFANYYNPNRMGFGLLRVLNDDIIEPTMGFGTHSHSNMEIISIPIYGNLEHRDSVGNSQILGAGEIQVMSAGSGIYHSEFNPDAALKANFLQLWIFPKEQNINPRYAITKFEMEGRKNKLQLIAAPKSTGIDTWINQDAYLYLSDLDEGAEISYSLHHPSGHGVFLFVIEGEVEVQGQKLGRRDAIGLSSISKVEVAAKVDSKLLIIDVPMG